MDENGLEEDKVEDFLPGFKDVNSYTQATLRAVLQATKVSNDLPASGDDFDYYSSFQGFRDVMDIEGKRILHIVQKVLKHQNVKANLADSSDALELDEKFDQLIDANDQMLERVGNWLDEASGVRKNESTLVVASLNPRPSPIASWNKKSPAGGSSSFRLLAARGIQRPQLRFKDKIDNSNRPFVPNIRSKPNALKSLEDSLRLPDNVDQEMLEAPDFVYPHPYQYELDHFKPVADQLCPVELQTPPPLKDTPVSVITTVSDLAELCDLLKTQTEIAVDLEHHSYRTYHGITCLMQISTRQSDYLIDALELRSDMHILNEVFTDPKITKVLHGSDSDVDWLQRDFGIYVVNMFDTGQAARLLNLSRFSLAHLLQTYCLVEADKQYQLADWRIRPLPNELIKYAREDTHYLLYIYDRLKNELIERGNEQKNLLISVIHRSTQICKKVNKKMVFRESDYMELYRKSKKMFNSRQLMALKNIYAWRDKVARQEDESTGYVCPNHMLLQIADILPREKQGVFACCNPIPPLVRQCINDIHGLIMEARESPLVKVEVQKKEARPTAYQHPKYAADSMLNCPHDMSKQHEEEPASQESVADASLIAKTASMFADQTTDCVTIKDKPVLTAFCRPRRNGPATETHKKAARIRMAFISPIQKYLPKHVRSEPVSKPVVADSERLTEMVHMNEISWKLMRNTVKRKEPEPSVPEKTVVTPDPPPKRRKVEIRESEIEAQPLRGKKTKTKKKKKKFIDDSNSERLTSQPPEDKAQSKIKQQKMEKAPDLNDFSPYDYSKADMNMFEGGTSQKAGGVFDPSGKKKKGKGHKVSKPKLSSAKSNKSYSYGGKQKGGATQSWPKL